MGPLQLEERLESGGGGVLQEVVGHFVKATDSTEIWGK